MMMGKIELSSRAWLFRLAPSSSFLQPQAIVSRTNQRHADSRHSDLTELQQRQGIPYLPSGRPVPLQCLRPILLRRDKRVSDVGLDQPYSFITGTQTDR